MGVVVVVGSQDKTWDGNWENSGTLELQDAINGKGQERPGQTWSDCGLTALPKRPKKDKRHYYCTVLSPESR